MATIEEKQIAKEILVTYIGKSDTGFLFASDTVAPSLQFESIWDRIIKKVSESGPRAASPAQ